MSLDDSLNNLSNLDVNRDPTTKIAGYIRVGKKILPAVHAPEIITERPTEVFVYEKSTDMVVSYQLNKGYLIWIDEIEPEDSKLSDKVLRQIMEGHPQLEAIFAVVNDEDEAYLYAFDDRGIPRCWWVKSTIDDALTVVAPMDGTGIILPTHLHKSDVDSRRWREYVDTYSSTVKEWKDRIK